MSDSEDSTVTYTVVSSLFGGLSDIGSPGVIGPEHEGLPWMLDDPYVQVTLQPPPPSSITRTYIPGPEEPQSPPPSDFVPEPVYPEFMPPEDEIPSAEDQSLPAADSPTTDSPGYIPESDPEEDPKEDDDEDPREDPVDYLADGGDDGDDEDEPSDDDEDEEVDIEVDDEEEEEHPALVDSIAVALPASYSSVGLSSCDDPAESRGCIYFPFTTITTTHHTLHTDQTTHILRTPPLHLLSTDRRADRPEVTLPPRKRLGIALGPRYEVGESSSAAAARPAGGLRADYGFVATIDREIRRDLERDVGYGITDSWDEIVKAIQGTPVVTDVQSLARG
ncbi:hypothetical protein Tco_0988754 [Tanacetum coccineum]|uniref:Uncharacterized protein n=1 Tax=Tanacetum coccineum TaxID=301880 RepID=A0ABQ5ESQ7_9ASTR